MKTSKLLSTILAAMSSAVLCVQAQTQFTNGLVAYYPFNGNANDASGNGNNGVVNGAVPVTNRFGMASSAYSFFGSNSVVVPYNANLFPQTQTISIWLKSAAFDGVSVLVSGGLLGDGWRGYYLGNFNFNSEFGFQDYTGSGYAAQIGLPKASWPANEWFQIVYVRTATTAQLFQNGQLVAQATNLPSNVVSQSSPLFIGSNTDVNGVPHGGFYSGAIDDIRIYNRALSPSEVQQLYAYESGPRVNLIKAVKPSFDYLTVSTNYQLQVSGDMSTWTNHGSPFTATSTSMIYPQYWDVANWEKLFFRLQVSP